MTNSVRVRISDHTIWPNPNNEELQYLHWKLLHSSKLELTKGEKLHVSSVISAYIELITNPAFTLKIVQKKVSGIRKAIK